MIEFDEHTSKAGGFDLTPMIDVVFLLLIFFLLTSIFAKPSLPLDLPESETASVANNPEVSVAIKKDGSVLLNGHPVGLEKLPGMLSEEYGNGKAKDISLVSDKDVPFGRVVEIMDIAKKAGAENIVVLAEKKQ
ncbi:MAG: biopolymer transporter ExbD [Alphaproteobacteria bacterium]|uniref:Biopolymer transporter ExbD n=1 Tax=Candidatus Nitrobium versatile TaxID=2884831 RepID=A0A953JDI9_9BACT|nr:biopolymer transporter ExbD [Candidatus Nitrobium versatile]